MCTIIVQSSSQFHYDATGKASCTDPLRSHAKRASIFGRDFDQSVSALDVIPSFYLDGSEGTDLNKTNRLAIANLDWDHIRASHLYNIITSLLLSGSASNETFPSNKVGRQISSERTRFVGIGEVLSVRIYASLFGQERLRRDELDGPSNDVLEVSEENGVDQLKQRWFRKYQLEKLR